EDLERQPSPAGVVPGRDGIVPAEPATWGSAAGYPVEQRWLDGLLAVADRKMLCRIVIGCTAALRIGDRTQRAGAGPLLCRVEPVVELEPGKRCPVGVAHLDPGEIPLEGVARERAAILSYIRDGSGRTVDLRPRRIVQRETEQGVARRAFDGDAGKIFGLVTILIRVWVIARDGPMRIRIFARAVGR